MPLLGLDLSLLKTGWAALDFETGNLCEHGVIRTDPAKTLSSRLYQIEQELYDILLDLNPFDVYVEAPISFGSATTTIELGMVHGVARLAICEFGLDDPGLANPSTLKRWATGRGRAGKDEMVMAAESRWSVVLTDDEADAAWVADYGVDCVRKAMAEQS